MVIKGPTRIGQGNHFYQFSSIGEDCQDKKYAGERTELIIGDNNVFREGVDATTWQLALHFEARRPAERAAVLLRCTCGGSEGEAAGDELAASHAMGNSIHGGC